MINDLIKTYNPEPESEPESEPEPESMYCKLFNRT